MLLSLKFSLRLGCSRVLDVVLHGERWTRSAYHTEPRLMDEKVSDRWVDYEIWVWVNLSSTETVKCMNIQLRNDCRRKTSATSAGSRKDSTLSNVGQRLCMRMPGVKQSFTDTFYSTWTKSDWPISHGRQLVVINSNLPQRSTQAYVSCAQSHTRRSPQRSLAALHGALIAWMKFRIRPQSGPL